MTEVTCAARPPGNYLQDYNDQFKDVFRKHRAINIEAVAELAAFGQVATEASCWVLNAPARDFIMNTTLPDDALQDWHLPYPRMLIEWQGTWDEEALVKHNRTDAVSYVPALERMILLSETEATEVVDTEIDPDTGEACRKTDCQHGFEGFYVTSFFKQPAPKPPRSSILPWVLNPVALLVPYSCFNHLKEWLNKTEDNDLNMLTVPPSLHQQHNIAKDRPTPVCAMQCAIDEWPNMVAQGQVREGIRDLIEEVHIALGLLAMLRCDNVPTRTVKASRLKQDRRKKQKKSRIPDYRVLHLSDHTFHNYAGGGGQAGEKAPHWRRGHIRNQPTAMGTIRKWIAPQIIRADKLTNGDMPKPRTAIT